MFNLSILIGKKLFKLILGKFQDGVNDVGFTSRLGLNTMTLQVASNNVYSGQGVAISVTGIAQVLANTSILSGL